MSSTVDIKLALYTAVAVAALAVAFILPAQALAGSDCESAGSDPTAAQYCSEPPPPIEEEAPVEESEVAAEVTEVTPPPEESTGGVAGVSEESGSLPFTGADLLALAAVACAFICIGLALQRLSTAKPGSR